MIYSNMFENWVKAKDVFHGDFISLKIFCISKYKQYVLIIAKNYLSYKTISSQDISYCN